MPKVIVPVKEEILRSVERRRASGAVSDASQHLAELIDLGFEHRLGQLYQEFEAGEISLEYFADELGLGLRDLYAALEKRGWPTSNIPTQATIRQ
ncbi:MAG: hypothetical protein MAG451_02578 [Anaerolineales bacterium]|nr:hypothetical protein [Anaerolineales bacterium]